MLDPALLNEPAIKRKYNIIQASQIIALCITCLLSIQCALKAFVCVCVCACVCVGRLGQALDMMNHAVSGTFVPGVRENMAYFTSTERRSTVYVPTHFPLSSLCACE